MAEFYLANFLPDKRQIFILPSGNMSVCYTASNLRLAAQRQAPVREEREVLDGLGREKTASEIVVSPPPRKSTVQKIKRKKSPRAHAKTPRSELQSDAARPARSVNAAALITFRNT